ncbi:hypothetical protein ARMGADRAFT_1086156 [Armillaria gallica]|uniref:Uncharacterized protein n=1 Tax=Armillaria gallica TaxID=47427 RepID=A0A2H3CYX4_ARMGA|nr:hypothetical protein ARMGADRAFT_1086156 [Armillaria gallica]
MARAAAYSSILSAFNQYLLASFLIAVATALTAVMILASGSALRTIYAETVF